MVSTDSDVQWLQRTKPFFPDEVIQEIVDIALIQNQTTPSTISLVCKVMYRWMIPIIFRSIRLTWEEDKQGLLNLITDGTRDLATHVRNLHLVFPGLDDIDDTYAITYAMNDLLLQALRRCTHLERLIFDRWDPDEFMDQQVANLKTYPGPWDVRIPTDNPSYVLKLSNSPYLRNVTHFYCGKFTEFVCEKGIEYFAMLPHVTHLAFAVDDIWGGRPRRAWRMVRPFKTLQTWLGRPSLKMVYVEYLNWNKRFRNGVLGYSRDWDRLIALQDERLFVGKGLMLEFEHLMQDGAAVWDCVRERFGNWRVTVRDPDHIHEEYTDSDTDFDSEI